MLKHIRRFGFSFALLTLVVVTHLDAQDFPSVRIFAKGANGYMAVVGRDTMLIITQEFVDSIGSWHKELKMLRKETDLQRRALTAHEQADVAQEKSRGDARLYVTELEQQLAGYKELAAGYKRLNTARTFSLEGGFGASGSDTKPALMFGLGWSRVRFWTLLQESNVGGFVGANFPIF